MLVGGNAPQWETTCDHLATEAESWGIRSARALEIIAETLHQIVEATSRVTAHESIAARVPGYIRAQARNLASGKKAYAGRGGIPPHHLATIGTPRG